MKTKHIFFTVAVFTAVFFFACNKKDVLLDPPVPTPDYRDNFEGYYQCRQVDIMKEELTNITIDTVFDDTVYIDVSVDHDLPGYIHVNEREIPIDSTGIFIEYKYYLQFDNDSLFINMQHGGNGEYKDTFIKGKKLY
jgi:hypothetical protein